MPYATSGQSDQLVDQSNLTRVVSVCLKRSLGLELFFVVETLIKRLDYANDQADWVL